MDWNSANYRPDTSYEFRKKHYRAFDPLNVDHRPSIIEDNEITYEPIFPRLGRYWEWGSEYLYYLPDSITSQNEIAFRLDSDELGLYNDDYSVYDYENQETNFHFCREAGWVIVRDRRDQNWLEHPMPWGWASLGPLSNAEMMYHVRNFPLSVKFYPVPPDKLFTREWADSYFKADDPIQQLPYQELVSLGFLKG